MLYDATQFWAMAKPPAPVATFSGDMDGLASDLGNPDSAVSTSVIPINFGGLIPFLILADATGLSTPINGSNKATDFHPMKGPFTTQTLRGLANSGAMHWRGDRSTGPMGTDPFSSNVSFMNFAPAFQTLVGSATSPSAAQMRNVRQFQLQVLPPPIRCAVSTIP